MATYYNICTMYYIKSIISLVFCVKLWYLTWSCSRCYVDGVAAIEGDSLVGVIIWVICEHLQWKKQSTTFSSVVETLSESLLIVFKLFTESMKHSPGFFWSAAESVSTLWKINKQDWETEGRLWSKSENNEAKREYLHWFVFTVCAQVECWAVHEVNHDEILPGIALWWSHTWSKIKGVNYPYLLKVNERWEWMS